MLLKLSQDALGLSYATQPLVFWTENPVFSRGLPIGVWQIYLGGEERYIRAGSMVEGGDDFVKERNVEFLVKVEYALHFSVTEQGVSKRDEL